MKVYPLAYELAMDIFFLSKGWPEEERYSVSTTTRGGGADLTDADGENSETDTRLDFSRDCGYLNELKHAELTTKYREVGKMLGNMLSGPGPFILKPVRAALADL